MLEGLSHSPEQSQVEQSSVDQEVLERKSKELQFKITIQLAVMTRMGILNENQTDQERAEAMTEVWANQEEYKYAEFFHDIYMSDKVEEILGNDMTGKNASEAEINSAVEYIAQKIQEKTSI